MKKIITNITLCLIFLFLFQPAYNSVLAANDAVVVRAVLFYSPNCGHCHFVITEVFPQLFEQYGTQLEVIGIDVSQPDGGAFFMAAMQAYGIENNYVPTLVVGDQVLVGSQDIPERFPILIENFLSQGGVDWPNIPGLREAMAASATAEAEQTVAAEQIPAAVATQAEPGASVLPAEQAALQTDTLAARIARDPQGNTLSILVLVGMLAVVASAVYRFPRLKGAPFDQLHHSLIPLLSVLGLLVAAYLAFVETTQTQAVCGPVGDCNTVQQSEYARLFGMLPIGLLGLAGYILILSAWAVVRYARPPRTTLAALALFGMAAFGVVFSIYLTFLEPFVIGATCAWCLTSAVLMTALFWLVLDPSRAAWLQWRAASRRR